MKLTKAERALLREMFGGRCAYCGQELPENGWHADHVAPVYREWWKRSKQWKEAHGFNWEFDELTQKIKKVPANDLQPRMMRPQNDRLENLFPACRACNLDKGVDSLEDWRAYLQDGMIQNMRKYIPNFRHAERFGRIIVATNSLVFWFEKFALAEDGSKTGVDSKANMEAT